MTDDRPRCGAPTKSGKPCRAIVSKSSYGSNRCSLHGPQAPEPVPSPWLGVLRAHFGSGPDGDSDIFDWRLARAFDALLRPARLGLMIAIQQRKQRGERYEDLLDVLRKMPSEDGS